MSAPTLTTAEFARLCNVTPGTILDWVKKGEVAPLGRTPGGHYRFSDDQVAQLLRGRASERARDIEAHVIEARALLRMHRGRAG